MRYFVTFWLIPVGFLVAWYGLSAHDIAFGTTFFSRDMHDLVFGIYADMLGIAPEAIPPLLLKALVLDTALILGLIALRKRKRIIEWWNRKPAPTRLEQRISAIVADGQAHPAE